MSWLELNPANITGAGGSAPDRGSGGLSSGIEASVGTAAGPTPPIYSPDNPLFWFAIVLVGTAVLIGASVSVKAGPFKAKASA